jgi:DNA-binding NarL/FixJ family response regulator
MGSVWGSATLKEEKNGRTMLGRMNDPNGQHLPMPPVRVLLADDHAPVACQLRELLEDEFDVVAVVQDGGALVTAVDSLAPDVIVTDISMPGVDGIAAATTILQKHPDAKVVFLTVHRDAAVVQKGLATGALGYVLKLMAGEELVPAIHAVLQGHRYVSNAIQTAG